MALKRFAGARCRHDWLDLKTDPSDEARFDPDKTGQTGFIHSLVDTSGVLSERMTDAMLADNNLVKRHYSSQAGAGWILSMLAIVDF